ncbi:MAG: hypothetical protein ACREOO_21125 [bacterium]
MVASENNKTSARMKMWAICYNQIPNIFWSVLSFTPLGYFWYMVKDLKWLYILLAVSFLGGFLPNTFFDAVQLGKTTSIYEKIGIRFVKKFTQDGDVINRFIRRKFPRYRVFDHNQSIQKYLAKAYSIERIHFVMFLFFLLTSVYALARGYAWWAAILTFNNLVFNLYPNFLQQYNRLRLRHLMERRPAS